MLTYDDIRIFYNLLEATRHAGMHKPVEYSIYQEVYARIQAVLKTEPPPPPIAATAAPTAPMPTSNVMPSITESYEDAFSSDTSSSDDE